MVDNPLRRRVDLVVDTWRLSILAIGILFATIFFVVAGWVAALISAVITFISYRVGLLIIAAWVTRTTTQDEFMEALRADAINEINHRVANGTLEPGSEEMAALLEKAGLRVAPMISEVGPIFGRYGEINLYDWVEATAPDGTVLRYNYVGVADIRDNIIVLPDETKSYICIEGILYELVSTSAPEAVASDTPDGP